MSGRVYFYPIQFSAGTASTQVSLQGLSRMGDIEKILIHSYCIVVPPPPNAPSGVPSTLNLSSDPNIFRETTNLDVDDYTSSYPLVPDNLTVTPLGNYRFTSHRCSSECIMDNTMKEKKYKMPDPIRFSIQVNPIHGYPIPNGPRLPATSVTFAESSIILLKVIAREENEPNYRQPNMRYSEVNSFANN